jgi:hypothetical protein
LSGSTGGDYGSPGGIKQRGIAVGVVYQSTVALLLYGAAGENIHQKLVFLNYYIRVFLAPLDQSYTYGLARSVCGVQDTGFTMCSFPGQ